MDSAIVLTSEFDRGLSETKDIWGAKKYIYIAKQAEVFYKALNDAEKANIAKGKQLRAERRAGEILKEMPKNGGTRGSFNGRDSSGSTMIVPPENNVPTLDDLDIDRHDSERWQLLAKLPQDKFDEFIDDKIARGYELTAGALVKYAKNYKPGEDGKQEPTRDLHRDVITYNIYFAQVLNAIDMHDAKWLLSDDCAAYFRFFDWPYKEIKKWAEEGCPRTKTLIMSDVLSDLMEGSYKPPALEGEPI